MIPSKVSKLKCLNKFIPVDHLATFDFGVTVRDPELIPVFDISHSVAKNIL